MVAPLLLAALGFGGGGLFDYMQGNRDREAEKRNQASLGRLTDLADPSQIMAQSNGLNLNVTGLQNIKGMRRNTGTQRDPSTGLLAGKGYNPDGSRNNLYQRQQPMGTPQSAMMTPQQRQGAGLAEYMKLDPAGGLGMLKERLFAPPPSPITVNDQLVDPLSGRVIGDYRTQTPPERKILKDAQGRQRYADTGEYVFSDVQTQPQNPAEAYEAAVGAPVPKDMIPVRDPSQPSGWGLQYQPGSDKDPGVVAQKRLEELAKEQPDAKASLDATKAPLNVMRETISRLRGKDAADGTPTITEAAKYAVGSPASRGIANVVARNFSPDINSAFSDVEFLRNAAQVQGLQLMRNASKTGGAVGQVTEREWPKVEALIGNLDPEQGEPSYAKQLAEVDAQLEKSMKAIEDAYLEVYSPVMGKVAAPEGITPEVWNEMTPEEKALFDE
jgi:hypothetical protein